ncbi:MAG TPA: MYXO-CTERM sorting domain-containing protein, partial [Polyangiaceae bacterium]|nr:MYXO-CTERM sorting domain-containing protein [Polyangiaceae bacterium]
SPGLTLCGALCVDLATDPAHCGRCEALCVAPQVCSAAACAASCPAGQTQCGQACVALDTHVLNCGTCGHACLSGQVCTAGQCMGTPTGGDVSLPATADGSGSDDSGCGCAVPASRPALGGLPSALLGLSLLVRRRRRRGLAERTPRAAFARTSPARPRA